VCGRVESEGDEEEERMGEGGKEGMKGWKRREENKEKHNRGDARLICFFSSDKLKRVRLC